MLCLSGPVFLFEIASLIPTKLRAGFAREYYQKTDFSFVSLKCKPNKVIYFKKAKASQEINYMQVLLRNRNINDFLQYFFNKSEYLTNEENVMYDCPA